MASVGLYSVQWAVGSVILLLLIFNSVILQMDAGLLAVGITGLSNGRWVVSRNSGQYYWTVI